MSQEALPGQVMAVEQGGKGRAEQPVGEEIGGKVHQNGRVGMGEAKPAKQVNRVIGGQRQQGHAHDAA